MAEENTQPQQETGEAGESREKQTSQRSEENKSESSAASSTSSDQTIPKHRFDEVNRRMKEAETQLKQMEQEREQAQEERAQKQGEYQELANKRQKKIEKLEEELKQVKTDWTRERRMNVWNQAAQGIIKSEAINDAFQFLSKDELDNIDDTDETAFATLAQNLVEVRSYLAAEGPRGAGSGGSRQPVLGHRGSPNGQTRQQGGTITTDRQPIFHDQKRKRRPWK